MKKTLIFALTVLVLLFVAVGPVFAIQYGQPDGDGHPYVGLMVAYIDGVPQWRCSGTLISPTVFLTAGHCTFGANGAQVWFDPTVVRDGTPATYPYGGGVWGTPIPHPGFDGTLTLPNTNDVGVVVLSSPVTTQGFGALPVAGTLDALAAQKGQQPVNFTVVGYGLQGVKPVYSAERTRYVGTVQLVNLTSALTDGYNVHYSNDPGNGNGPGGTCFGDSGGPVFQEGTNVVLAVNSFVLNENCKGAGFAYRIDIANSLDFLAGFGP